MVKVGEANEKILNGKVHQDGINGSSPPAPVSFIETSSAAVSSGDNTDDSDQGTSPPDPGVSNLEKLGDELAKVKLNPMAEEFRPPPVNYSRGTNSSGTQTEDSMEAGSSRQCKRGKGKSKRKGSGSEGISIHRTIFVSEIDNSVTEEQLAGVFSSCGQVIDCRICGDPNSALRFAFVEFTAEEAVEVALGLHGAILNFQPISVLPSKTSIVPVNPRYLPKSQEELELCSRTVYVTNIDRAIHRNQIINFFRNNCGAVSRSRLLGNDKHPTRIAFIEFQRAESAMGALNCSGAVIGQYPLRVSPSKTPVRTRLCQKHRKGSRDSTSEEEVVDHTTQEDQGGVDACTQ